MVEANSPYREQIERFRTLFAHSPSFAAVLAGPDHDFFLANPAFDRLVANRAVIGSAIAEAVPELVGQVFLQTLNHVFETGDAQVGRDEKMRLRRPDGVFETRRIDLVYQPLRDADGRIIAIFVEGTDVTDRFTAVEVLRQTEQRNRQILDSAVDYAIIATDLEGRITHWNRGAQRTLGWREAEMLGHTAERFFTFEDRGRNQAQKEIESALMTGRSTDERWHVRKSGERFWASGEMTPLRNDRGDATGFVKILRDRTAEHQAEAALRESEARLRFFAELEDSFFGAAAAFDAMRAATEILGRHLGASRCAYADVDTDGDRFWIRSDYNAPGLESSVGEYRLELFGPRAAIGLRSGQPLVVRDVVRELAPGEGREMFQAISIDAIICCPLIKNGRLTAMMAVHQKQPRAWSLGEISLVRDVVERCWAHVERVGAEARLRESEERVRLAVNNADIGFWDVDVVNNRLIWPPATKAMFGISPDVSVTMQDFYEGLHPDDREATGNAFKAAADPQLRALYDVEYRTVGKEDGVVRWVAAKGRGVFDAEGRCTRIAGTAIQITARKVVEEALQELNVTLEARIAKAIADREEAQEALRQSQKMEAMGQLTGGVAHDFNNLLTPIVGTLDLLQRKGLGSEREHRLIAGAIQSADRAKTLVQRLLAFARRQPLQASAVDVPSLVTGIAELLASTSGPQIQVVVETAELMPAAQADANQLEMALLNLGVNARDAMPEGGTLRITASSECIGPGHRSKLGLGEYIRLSVADTGVGMDEATVRRAVEPFFSTKGVGKGTGLGLSMAHGLASQLGGALTIDSQPGFGTNVQLWLPVSEALADTLKPSSITVPLPAARGTALLVDDEELVRMSTADMLADIGYAVVEAASAEEALNLLSNGLRPDLLVTDHLMPGTNGTQLALIVQSNHPHIKVLIVSGYADSEGVDADLPRLAKPFRNVELATKLAELEEEGQTLRQTSY